MTDDSLLPGNGPDRIPRVRCSQCNSEWDLTYELDSLHAGNQALEQFALDHQRHTGHFPDAISPWIADCLRCPDEERYLTEAPARRWAETHARHTTHRVELRHAEHESMVIDGPIATPQRSLDDLSGYNDTV